MNAYPSWAGQLDWLLNHSLQAGVLVLLVLAMQRLFRRQLTSRWRFALWWIVLARLLLPFSPPSAVSLFNYFQPAVQLERPHPVAPAPPIATHDNEGVKYILREQSPTPYESPRIENAPAESPITAAGNLPERKQPAPPVTAPKRISGYDDFLLPGLAGVWLTGLLILSGVVAAQLLRFHRRLAGAAALADPKLQMLLDDCRREFGLSRRVELWETDAVQSPALFGLVRLRLLVPRGFGAQFAGRELRYIFLHELAHVKRGDLWLNWLVTVLQILHWFNPLLWLGFARLRADRELACDELVLLRAGDNAGTAYGETVVKLLENLSRPAAIPGLVGILEDKKQMRRRIAMIANFRRPGRGSALAVILIAVVAAAALTDAQSNRPGEPRIKIETNGTEATHLPANKSAILFDETYTTHNTAPHNQVDGAISTTRPDLTGMVSAKGGGALPVPATIFIATAAPKTGTSTFCPSCYADCIKHSQADAQGNFKIESLDPQLTFQILAVAKGYQPKSISKVDPANGPVKIELAPVESADAAPDRSLRGRVVNAAGQPVAGAAVEVRGIETKAGGGRWGSLPGTDPLAVTDADGEFLITAKTPFELMSVQVTARAFAPGNFNRLASGATRHALQLTEGAALIGRVLRDSQPLGGVSIGLSAVDRTAGNYHGHFEVGTDTNGGFAFVNLPPDVDFWIYGVMGTMKTFGAVPIQKLHTGNDGETTNAGDLIAAPAHRLAGRVVLSDGQPLPPKVRLLVSRQEAWDSMQIALDADGNFDTAGIPSELIDLSARVKGYRVSARNSSLDQLNPFQIIGRVERDITNLIFMLEKGPDPQPDYRHVDPEYNEIRQRPLRGAEGGVDHSREWLVSGRVLDRETKLTVQHFRVTPGQTDQFNRAVWNTLRAVDGSNGVYATYISKRTTGQPMLKVEADGYLPAGTEIQPGDATNVDFILKPGGGPAGRVVTADGKPAADATLVLLCGEMNEASFYPAGELKAFGNSSAFRTTNTNGNFAFKAIYGMKSVAVASSNGFIIVNLELLATNPLVTLEPFGQVTGTLNRTSGPGTNEDLDLVFCSANGLRNGINLQTRTTTDATGRFTFNNVPAGHLQINHLVPMGKGGGSWRYEPLKEVDVKPGETLAVNIAAPDYKPEKQNSYEPPPLKPVPGEHVKGVVLTPDGKPAAEAEVALQLTEGPFNLSLGRGTFVSSGLREKGLLVNAGADGRFDLPLFENAVAVVAVNEAGFAQVTLDELKTSPEIHLQKFGRVEGTLRVGHHPGTNETVNVSAAAPRWNRKVIRLAGRTNNVLEFTNSAPPILQPLMFDFQAFQARTDANGKFAIAFVPPGARSLWRKIPNGENSWTQSQLATVNVGPGETVVTNAGGNGRIVAGKVHFAGDLAVDFKSGMGVITTPTYKFFEKVRQLKTDAERRAFYESPEAEAMQAEYRSFSVRVAEDGTFRTEDVLPGSYEFVFQPAKLLDEKSRAWVMLASAQEFAVPPAKNADDDSPVEWGAIELKKRILPMPETGAK